MKGLRIVVTVVLASAWFTTVGVTRAAAQEAKPTRPQQAELRRPDHPERPDRPERRNRPERPNRPERRDRERLVRPEPVARR